MNDGYTISVYTGLIDPKHVRNMRVSQKTTALWMYLWFLDKMTKIDPETKLGTVLGGKPIKLDDFCFDLKIDIKTARKMFHVLLEHEYIIAKRTPYGNIIKVTKAKKIFGQKMEKSGRSPLSLDNINVVGHISKSGRSNKDNTVRHNNILISKDINTASSGFGNPQINELSKYLLSVMNIPKEDCTQAQSRRYWYLLIRESKTGIDGVKWLVDLAGQDKFYRDNISSSKDLYYKRVKLIQRKRGSAPKIMM